MAEGICRGLRRDSHRPQAIDFVYISQRRHHMSGAHAVCGGVSGAASGTPNGTSTFEHGLSRTVPRKGIELRRRGLFHRWLSKCLGFEVAHFVGLPTKILVGGTFGRIQLDLFWASASSSLRWGATAMNLDEALRHGLDGQALLFTGAGFSCDAKNRSGSCLPTGNQLATTLAGELKLTTVPSLDIVSDMYKERNGEGALARLLRD